MTPSELRPQLEAAYIKLFGTIIGNDLIQGGPPMRTHVYHLNPDQMRPVWAELNAITGLELDDHDQHYIWWKSFNSALEYITFLINKRLP